jgi:putative GTP diphosphokinase
MLHDISDVLSDQLGVNIRKVTISSDNGIFEGTIEMQVHDRKDVQFIVENMKNIKDVQEVLEIL